MLYIKTANQALDIYNNSFEEENISEFHLKLLSRAVNLEPLNFEAHFQRGIFYYINENYGKALSDLMICFDNDYKLIETHLYQALALVELKYYETAYDFFQYSDIKTLTICYDMYGKCLLKLGYYKKACYYLSKYIELEPDDHRAYYWFARALFHRKIYNKGLSIINKAIELKAGCNSNYSVLKLKFETSLMNKKKLNALIKKFSNTNIYKMN
jgi:tetratricopeptide (TPR) repeat protein